MATHTFTLPKLGNVAVNLNVANTSRDMSTGTVFLLATMAGSGGYFQEVNVISLGTNAACVLRFFINNGSDPTVAANNTLVKELRLAATTASETSDQLTAKTQIGIFVPTGYRLYATRSAFTGGNAGFQALASYTEI